MSAFFTFTKPPGQFLNTDSDVVFLSLYLNFILTAYEQERRDPGHSNPLVHTGPAALAPHFKSTEG